MKPVEKPNIELLLAENAELRERLDEVQETLRAIREGEVDAVVVTGSKGDRIFALSEEENLPRLMVETMNEAGFAVTPEGMVVFCNHRAAVILGRPAGQLLGHKLGALIAPDDVARFHKLLQDTLSAPSHARIDFIGSFGESLPTHIWTSLLNRPENPLICLLATDLRRIEADRLLIESMKLQQEHLRNSQILAKELMEQAVAAREQAEHANLKLEQQQLQLQEAQRISHVGNWQWNPETDLMEGSEELLRILGFVPASAKLPKFLHQKDLCYPASDWERIHSAMWQALNTDTPFELDVRALRQGTPIWVTVRGEPVRNEEGRIDGLRGTVHDITSRKTSEAALLQSREDLNRAQMVAKMGSWRLDIRHDVLSWSEENYRIFGVPSGTPLNYEAFLNLVHSDDREHVHRQWQAGLQGEPYDIEHRIVIKNQVKWVRQRAFLEFDEAGKLIGGFGITQDITERKQVREQINASLAEKEVLLKEVHHRVKNNLQIISSLVNMQSQGQPDPHLRILLSDVRDRVRTMALVHEKLYQSADLGAVEFADYTRSLLQHLVRAHGGSQPRIRMVLDLNPVTLSVQQSIPCGLILNELVTNALKHAFAGDLDHQLNVMLQLTENHEVRLQVRDNGPGLPQEVNWEQPGSVGLRLVRMLTQQLEGTILSRDAEDGGAEFELAFKAHHRPPLHNT